MTTTVVPDHLAASPDHLAASPTSAAVGVTSLRKTYGATTALDGIDLVVPAGQMVAVLGPNGAGKSTLTELLTGLIEPDQGRVTIFGRPAVDAVRAGLVGAMLQNGALLEQARVIDMLRLVHGLHRHPLPLAEVIERAGISDLLRKRTDRLSGGQGQRVRFALAVMADPQLIILDEPTVGLDVTARASFWQAMRDWAARGRTVLFATHYLDEADAMADRVVVLTGGRIVADGTPEQVKAVVAGHLVGFTDDAPDPAVLAGLPGVVGVTIDGTRVQLRTTRPDDTLRAALTARPDAHDLTLTAPRLEDAVTHLTTPER